MTWILLAGAILSEVGGTLSLKASEGFTKPLPSVLVVIGYTIAFVLLALVLKRGASVGVVYAIWAGVGVALVAIFGRLVFGDPLPFAAVIGILLIIGGVVMVESASNVG